MQNKKSLLLWALILVFISSSITFVVSDFINIGLGNKMIVDKKDYAELESMSKLLELKNYIKQNYVDGANDVALEEGAIKGMFESLNDPYSLYMTSKEYTEFNDSTSGSYAGIGVIVTSSEEGYITVVSPIEGTPGEKAGLKTNDKIIKADDKDLIGMKLDAAVSLLKGKAGTKVTLTIARDGVKDPITVGIVREEIKLKTVKGKMLDNKIGYIRISMFDQDTSKEFKIALNDLKDKGMKGLVIDLRQNPGGYLDQCISIADELLDKGLIVYTVDINKKRKDFNSNDGKINVPISVLVDEGSASASEILSGALKDRKAAQLVGVTTFGKGLVQTVEQLKDGSGFKLTTEKYYTPNGISINKKGIEPNFVIKPLEIKAGQNPDDVKDVQLDKAVEEVMKQIK